jgi:hypothetical protein
VRECGNRTTHLRPALCPSVRPYVLPLLLLALSTDNVGAVKVGYRNMSLSSNAPLSEGASQFKLRARARHIEQLRSFPLPPPETTPIPDEQLSKTLADYKQWLLDCSKESSAQIQQAITQSMFCFGFSFGLH